MYDFEDPDIFLDLDVFAEKVQYNPRDGIARTIKAVVERDQPKKYGPQFSGGSTRNDIAPSIDVWIANHPINGASEIDTGGDTITLSRRQGFAAAKQGIAEVLGDSTPKMWHIRLR